eukprot:4649211-Pleurochrysis_carterae.AAC.2
MVIERRSRKDALSRKQHGSKPASSKRRRSPSLVSRLMHALIFDSKLQLILLALMLGTRHLSIYYMQVPLFSCDEDDPLVTVTPEFLSPEDLSALRSQCEGALSMHRAQALSNRFSRTYGYVLFFNADGIEDLQSGDFAFLAPYVEKVRDARANAFVLNLLVVPPSNSSDTEAAVGLHVDDTVSMSSVRTVYAHSVSVLYLLVPDGARGGELELYGNDRDAGAPANSTADTVLPPKQGSLVVFRGDAFHKVNAYHLPNDTDTLDEMLTATDKHTDTEGKDDVAPATSSRVDDPFRNCRVSLVLEQYRIPSDYYAYTTRFVVNRGDEYNEKSAASRQKAMAAALSIASTFIGGVSLVISLYIGIQVLMRPSDAGQYGPYMALLMGSEFLGSAMSGDLDEIIEQATSFQMPWSS